VKEWTGRIRCRIESSGELINYGKLFQIRSTVVRRSRAPLVCSVINFAERRSPLAFERSGLLVVSSKTASPN
jgi:hypothetical protein